MTTVPAIRLSAASAICLTPARPVSFCSQMARGRIPCHLWHRVCALLGCFRDVLAPKFLPIYSLLVLPANHKPPFTLGSPLPSSVGSFRAFATPDFVKLSAASLFEPSYVDSWSLNSCFSPGIPSCDFVVELRSHNHMSESVTCQLPISNRSLVFSTHVRQPSNLGRFEPS